MRYWFKQKTYGYGFQPHTWEGWLATLGLIAAVILAAYVNGFFDVPETQDIPIKNGLRFLLDTLIITTLFSIACKDKVEGGLKWRWGKNNRIDPNKPPKPPEAPKTPRQ